MRMRRRLSGFTLIELSVVIIILSLMLGGIMTAVNYNVRAAKIAELQKKMDAIELATLAFYKKYARLPCPATVATLMSVTSFGTEAANQGSCTGGAPAATYYSGNGRFGMVPVKTLELPDDYAIDPWGSRIEYHVDARFTIASGFTTYPVTNLTTGTYNILDAAGAARTAYAILVIVSHGPNGHGAFQVAGGRKNSGVTNTQELENCDCNSSGVYVAYDLDVVMRLYNLNAGGYLDSFDDIVRYYTRPRFTTAAEKLTESY